MATRLTTQNSKTSSVNSLVSKLKRSGSGSVRRYAARKGSSFEHFEVGYFGQEITGFLKNGNQLTARVDSNGLASFLAAPIRLRGQVLQQLLVSM